MNDLEAMVGLLAKENASLKATLRSIHYAVAAVQIPGIEQVPQVCPDLSDMHPAIADIDEILDLLRWHLEEKDPTTDSEAEKRLRELVDAYDDEECTCGCGECDEKCEEEEV